MWFRKKRVYRALLVALSGVCCAILFVFCLLAIILPKSTVSEAEKRELAQKPKFSISALFDGTYTRDYELYYADTFPFRDFFVRMASRVEDTYGVRYDDVKIVGGVSQSDEDEEDDVLPPATTTAKPISTTAASSAVTTKPVSTDGSMTSSGTSASEKETTSKATETTTTTQATETTTTGPGENVQGEKTNGIFIYGNRAFELFGGSTKTKYGYAQMVSDYAAKFPNVKVYNLVIPTSISFYLPEKYESYSASQESNIADIYGALSDDVTAVNVYSVLEKHKAEYIYFNTDHHWTGLGAYYAYTEFANAAGFKPYAYADYEKGTIEGFLGTLATSSNDSKLLNNPDLVEYCYPPVDTHTLRWGKGETEPTESTVMAEYAKGTNAYSVYLHGDWPRTDIINEEATNDKCILVFKESYGNAFVPYLAPHYEKVIVIDERYFTGNLNKVVEEEGVDEILIINNAFAANTKSTTTRLNAFIGK